MTIESINIESIKSNPNNPRTIKGDKFKKLVKSIKDFPEMLKIRPIVVDDDNMVLGGNMRLKACKEAGLKEVNIIKASNLTEEQKEEFIIKDNVGYGEWDYDLLLEDWDKQTLIEWGVDIKTKLSDRFIVPPFSVLDTRQGEWQERKKIWKEYLKEDGESRKNTLSKGDSGIYLNMKGGVSLFDPVIAEVCFHWFAPENSNIFDPFAGDIRKGAVCGFLGHTFSGIELRKEQYDINIEQIKRLELNNVIYHNDDGRCVDKYIDNNTQDLLFSCPPYFNIEEYSQLENDASNQKTYEDFIKILDEAFTSSISKLKNNRFAVIIVGDIRDNNGYYYNFHEDIKFIFNKGGMLLYNEMILIEPIGLNSIRANKLMERRKLPKFHQNILVFYKPDENKLPYIESIYRKIFVFYKGDYNKIKNEYKQFSYKNIDLYDGLNNDIEYK